MITAAVVWSYININQDDNSCRHTHRSYVNINRHDLERKQLCPAEMNSTDYIHHIVACEMSQLPVGLAPKFRSALDSEAAIQATRLLLEAHKASPLFSPKPLKAHQRRVMTSHFRALPRELLQTFMDVYSLDFALFHYQARPADIVGA
ncbi:hypothetical protein ACOMHN_052004 [Nucella lapillus]